MAIATLAPESACNRYLSDYGILTWSDHDRDGSADAGVLEDCQRWATEKLIAKLRPRYDAANLYDEFDSPASTLIQEAAVVMCLRRLCLRRGNPAPESLEFDYQELMKDGGWLDKVCSGKEKLVDVDGNLIEMRPSLAVPSFSNLTVDRRYPAERIRVVKQSSDNRPTSLEQDTVDTRGIHDG